MLEAVIAIVIMLIKMVVVFTVVMLMVAYATLMERRVLGRS